jgi:hypothetical protein
MDADVRRNEFARRSIESELAGEIGAAHERVFGAAPLCTPDRVYRFSCSRLAKAFRLHKH